VHRQTSCVVEVGDIYITQVVVSHVTDSVNIIFCLALFDVVNTLQKGPFQAKKRREDWLRLLGSLLHINLQIDINKMFMLF